MRDKVPALTGIRGVAAAWVVLFHFRSLFDRLDILGPLVASRATSAGYLAVDLFFILSGFVLARAYAGRAASASARTFLVDFAVNRGFRILPLNTVALLLFLSAVLVFGQRHWTDESLSVGSFLAALFLVQSWGFSSPTAWNTPAWSLSAEWLAYAAFPAGVAAANLVRARWLAGLGWTAALAALVAVMIGWGHASLDHSWSLGMVRCLLQFGAGVLLWRWFDLSPFAGARADAFLATGGALLLVAVALPRFELLAPFAFAAIVVACAGRGRWTDRLLGNRPVALLGELSFSLYLLHFILLGLAVLAAERLGLPAASTAARSAYAALALGVVYVVALLAWRFVELPGQRLGRRVRDRAVAWAGAARRDEPAPIPTAPPSAIPLETRL